MSEPARSLVRRFQLASLGASAAVLLVAVAVWFGWLLDIAVLKSIHPSLSTMKPNTATGFLFLASALLLRQTPQPSQRSLHVSRGLAGMAALIGGLTLLEYASGWDLGIDQALWTDPSTPAHLNPGRMSPVSATLFALLGLAAVFMGARSERWRERPSQWLGLAAALLALVCVIGYAYGVRDVYGTGPFRSIALHSALAFLACALAILFARPEHALMRFVTAEGPGGVLARHLLPAAVLVPPLLGWLRMKGQKAGLYQPELGVSIFAAANVLCFTALIWWNAGAVFLSEVARRRAEETVRESEQDLAITLHSIGDAVVATDARGRVARMNAVAERWTGCTIEQARVAGALETVRLFRPGTRVPLESPVERVLREAAVVLEGEALLLARDGSERMVTVSGAPIRAAEGEGALRGVVLVLRDRTEELRAERNVRDSEARKAAVFEAALDCIVTMDQHGVILEFNAAAEKTLGFARSDVIGRPLAEVLIPPVLREQHTLGLRRYVDSGHSRIIGTRVELSVLRADGSELPAEIAVVRTQADGPPTFTGYIRDLTERRQAEEAHVLRAQKTVVESANRELEAFSYSVAHDLRSPLRAVEGFAGLLAEDCGEKLGGEGRDYLERIRAGVRRMEEIIDALLQLSRVSRAELRREDVNLSELVTAVLQHLRSDDPDRGEVACSVQPGLVAQCDPALVRVLLTNLLGNAWKFTRKREAARIEFGCTDEAGSRVYWVRDNGAGFDMADASKLFTPFTRLHAQRDFHGTGIGLATVQRVITRHGGRIRAEAAVEQGAAFFFSLS